MMESSETATSLAAERRQILATAEGRGFQYLLAMSRSSGERIFRRYRGSFVSLQKNHGLRPWLRSVAAPRLKSRDIYDH
jgi:hypothetical protein